MRLAPMLTALAQKSSYSQVNGHCTEAALRQGTVLVRDSKLGGASPVLALSPAEWTRFLTAIKEGKPSAA